MATPFDDGRVGIMVTDLHSLTIPWVSIPAYATDVFLPMHSPLLTPEKMQKAREDAATHKLRVQLWYDATHTLDGHFVAEEVSGGLAALKHSGGVEINLERPDDGQLGNLVDGFYTRFRQLRTTRAIALNFAPMKAYVALKEPMKRDPNCYVRVQTYYGTEMRPADPDECELDFVNRGFPRERYSIMYSAKPRRLIDGTIFNDLPVFADRGAYVRKLRRGSIFSLNLMREGGLL